MKTIKEINKKKLKDFEKKQKKWLDKNSKEPLVITGEGTCFTKGEYVKGEIYMSLRLHKKEILSLIEELEGKLTKERIFKLRKDNPQYSLGQTNGYFIAIDQMRASIKELKKGL